MAETGVYIHNLDLLERLNNQISLSSKEMANIDDEISNYLNSVKNDLEDQLRTIQEKLNAAKERLRIAEDALQSCQAAQVVTDIISSVVGVPINPCMAEESAVESARIEVEKWRMRYEHGQRIVEECQQEIGGYNNGGHALILNMCEQQTPQASQKLRNCIRNIEDILNSEVRIPSELNNNNVPEQPNKSLSQDKNFNSVSRISEEHATMNEKRAGLTSRCPKCGRPIPLCICNNLHV